MTAPPEGRVRIPLLIYAAGAALVAVGVALLPLLGDGLGGELGAAAGNLPLLPFVASGVGVFALLAYFAAGDTRAAGTLLLLLIVGHALGGLNALIALLGGDTAAEIGIGRWTMSLATLLGVILALDVALLLALVWLRGMAARSPALGGY